MSRSESFSEIERLKLTLRRHEALLERLCIYLKAIQGDLTAEKPSADSMRRITNHALSEIEAVKRRNGKGRT